MAASYSSGEKIRRMWEVCQCAGSGYGLIRVANQIHRCSIEFTLMHFPHPVSTNLHTSQARVEFFLLATQDHSLVLSAPIDNHSEISFVVLNLIQPFVCPQQYKVSSGQ